MEIAPLSKSLGHLSQPLSPQLRLCELGTSARRPIIVLLLLYLVACSNPSEIADSGDIQPGSHSLEIVGSGDIRSSSGTRNCGLEQQPCANEVVNAYEETYTAIARPGWKFSHWDNYCLESSSSCSFKLSANLVHENWPKEMPALRAVFSPISSSEPLDGVENDTLTLAEEILFVQRMDAQHFAVATATRLLVVENRDGGPMVIVTSVPSPKIYDLAVLGNRVALALGARGIQIYEYTDNNLLSSIGTVNYDVRQLRAPLGRFIALTSRETGSTQELLLIDIADNSSPSILSRLDTGFEYSEMVGSEYDSYTYLLDSRPDGTGELRQVTAGASHDRLEFREDRLEFDENTPLPGLVLTDGWYVTLVGHASLTESEQYKHDVVVYRRRSPHMPVNTPPIARFELVTEAPLHVENTSVSITDFDTHTKRPIRQLITSSNNGVNSYALPDLVKTEHKGPSSADTRLLADGTGYLKYNKTLEKLDFTPTTNGIASISDYLIEATATLHRYPAVDGEPLCSTTTLNYPRGGIRFPEECVAEPGLYLVTVEGGFDTATNIDDTGPAGRIPNAGKIRALLTQDQFHDTWYVNLGTEVVFNLVAERLASMGGNIDVDEFSAIRLAALKLAVPLSPSLEYSPAVDEMNLFEDLRYDGRTINGFTLKYYIASIIRAGEKIRTDDAISSVLGLAHLDYTKPVVQALLPESGTNILVSDRALVAQLRNRVFLYEIADNNELNLVSSIDSTRSPIALEEELLAVIVDEDEIFEGNVSKRLKVFDISNPYNPLVIANIPASNVESVALHENTLYTYSSYYPDPSKPDVLRIYDVSAPELANAHLSELAVPTCVPCYSVIQFHSGKLYVTGGYAVPDLWHYDKKILVIDVTQAENPMLLEEFVDYSSSNIPAYFVFDGNTAWLKSATPYLRRSEDTFLSNWPFDPGLRLFSLSREHTELSEITAFELPAQNLLSQKLAVYNEHLLSLDAHVLRSYRYPRLRPIAYWDLVSVIPFSETYYNMELSGSTAWLLGDGKIASLELSLTKPPETLPQ